MEVQENKKRREIEKNKEKKQFLCSLINENRFSEAKKLIEIFNSESEDKKTKENLILEAYKNGTLEKEMDILFFDLGIVSFLNLLENVDEIFLKKYGKLIISNLFSSNNYEDFSLYNSHKNYKKYQNFLINQIKNSESSKSLSEGKKLLLFSCKDKKDFDLINSKLGEDKKFSLKNDSRLLDYNNPRKNQEQFFFLASTIKNEKLNPDELDIVLRGSLMSFLSKLSNDAEFTISIDYDEKTEQLLKLLE